MGKLKKTLQRLFENMKKLHLPGIRADFEEITKMAQANSLSYEEYLFNAIRKRM